MYACKKPAKSMLNIGVLFILFLSCSFLYSQNKPVLKFSENGKFKIVQFTDVHLDIEKITQTDSILNIMITVISAEKPDLVVLTGDIATSKNVKEAWRKVTKPIIDAGIPWAVVFGNHDSEFGFTNNQIMDYLVTLPLNLSTYGPSNISGCGNYILEINGSKSNKPSTLIYCFDSHAYSGEEDNKELGAYGWIKFDQIAWYREQSKINTAKNNNKPYPAIALFHIPLPEYAVVQKKPGTIGDKSEDVCSPQINTGLYSAFYESKDVMASFCGHDHDNNFIGTLNNIALAYGCKTGTNIYGSLDKGGRVIVLYEGERKFYTWVHNTKDAVKYFVTYPDSFPKK